MTGLIDTHTLLWYHEGDSRLSNAARDFIDDPSHRVVVSAASLWEITIKVSLGKLTLRDPLAVFLADAVEGNDFRLLPIEHHHLVALAALPFHHRDPFDRLLVAQGIADRMPLLSADSVLDDYPVTRLW